ncbi:MAG: leucine-rich repeat domain-containing protein [Clostridiales bacterium]|nr:leucine-rich repeat domain-containing protein [Clostridiales bacterium]
MVATLQARVDILEYDNESYNMLCQVLFDKDVAHITARHLEKIGDTIPERLYGGAASEGSKILLSVEFPSNIKHIGTSAFGYCSNLESVVFNEGLETIDGYAFRNCQKLKMNGLPSTLTSIGDYAFYNCNKMSGLVLPSGLTSIGTAAFSGCTNMFTNIVIPVGVVELTSQVFYGCKTLESVVIHTGVTTIGSSAFYGCSALATIYYEGTVAEWNNITLDIDWDRNCGSGTESGCYTIVYDYMFEIAA